ncbi:hypothetical protein AcW1_006890 [Taiwanofungus camphoratus]|nr:hypothetical protein AcW1_006890 [Antrodia cinnamomea]
MEDMITAQKLNGTDLYSDTSIRMRERPKKGPQLSGRNFEDLGSDFAEKALRGSQNRTRSQVSTFKPSGPRVKSGKFSKINSRSNVLHLEDEQISSEDELDILSGPSARHESPPSRKEKISVSKDPNLEEGAIVNGAYHAYHKDFKPNKLTLSFKKIKRSENKTRSDSRTVESSASSSTAAQSSKLRDPLPQPRPTPKAVSPRPAPIHVDAQKKTDSEGSNAKPTVCDRPNTRNLPLHELSPNQGRPASPLSLHPDEADSSLMTPRQNAPERPKPRPMHRGAHKPQRQEFPLLSPLVSDDEREGEKGKETGRRGQRRTVCQFPTLSPLTDGKGSQTKVNMFPALSPLTSGKSSQMKGIASGESGRKERDQSNPFKNLSPLASHSQNRISQTKKTGKAKTGSAFPALSPLSSPLEKSQARGKRTKAPFQQNKRSKGKGRAVVISSEDDDVDDSDRDDTILPSLSRYKVQPFPMETQVLESIGHSPGKRASEEDSEGEGDAGLRRERKKRKADPNEILAELLRSDDMSDLDDEDLLFIDPDVDPASLCPWCDERLPPVPTPYLSTLIVAARASSSPDVRPTNPLGLRAPLGKFVGVCQRHRFESHQVPRAQRKGWPMQIAWNHVSERVGALRPRLQAIVDDVDEDFLSGAPREDRDDEDEAQWGGRPRKGSVFWWDVIKSVKKSGSRQAAGVRGQFASFEKTQPGYYGELGYVIINQTIYNLFPPASFDPVSTLPLTPPDFIQLILVPEAAVSLIMEDMGQTRTEAIKTLRESAEYGVAMFPDDHSEGTDAVDAGEQIVMERARARRKELEEEEREELWMALEVSDEERCQPRGKRRPKPKPRRSKSAPSDAEVLNDVKGLTKNRGGKPKGKSTREKLSCTETGSESDVIMLTDSESSVSRRGRRTRSTSVANNTRTRSKTRGIAASSDVNTDLHRPTPRPRPRRKGCESCSSQTEGEGEDKNKNNAPSSDSVDSDGQVCPPPSSSQEIPQVTRDRKANPHIRLIDPHATPKASRTSGSSSVSSTGATVGLQRKEILPLQIARSRHRDKLPATKLDVWSYTLRNHPAESTEDEITSLASNVPSNSNFNLIKPSRLTVAEKAGDENYDWLLSEASTPASPQ